MVTRHELHDVIKAVGLWNGPQAQTHRFRLSPDVAVYSMDEADALDALAKALGHCLAGISRIAVIAGQRSLGVGPHWKLIDRVLWSGSPAWYQPCAAIEPNATPMVCKVDLMRARDGRLLIAEIDGHNKHGLGYSVLARRLAQIVAPQARRFPGVASRIAERVAADGQLTILYADQERFYRPELEILQQELTQHGVGSRLVQESHWDGSGPIGRWLDLPRLDHHQPLREALVEQYRTRLSSFLIPPKPFLGAKAVMALLRNDLADPALEAILRSQIGLAELTLVRSYLPATILVGNARDLGAAETYFAGQPTVIKASVSSGMKGTFVSDDPGWRPAVARARDGHGLFVLQTEVDQLPVEYRWFSDDGACQVDQWYQRITLHTDARGVADIIVTATTDRRVHGGKECLQLGAIIEPSPTDS